MNPNAMEVGNVDSPEKTGAEPKKKQKGVDAVIVDKEVDTDTDSENWILMIEAGGKREEIFCISVPRKGQVEEHEEREERRRA